MIQLTPPSTERRYRRLQPQQFTGSDLHIYSGGIPMESPMVLGHEFMGITEAVEKEVKKLKRGDRVVAPFPIACGHCFFCKHDFPGNCESSNPEHCGSEGGLMTKKGGALFGYTDLYGVYDGGKAEYAHIPYALIIPVTPQLQESGSGGT